MKLRPHRFENVSVLHVDGGERTNEVVRVSAFRRDANLQGARHTGDRECPLSIISLRLSFDYVEIVEELEIVLRHLDDFFKKACLRK